MDAELFHRRFLEEWDVRDIAPVKHDSGTETEKPEAPRKIIFSINDWCKGGANITVARIRLRRTATVEKGNYLLFQVDETIRRRISPDEFDAIVTLLFDRCGFENWDEEYRDPDVLDGVNWKITVTFDHKPDLVRRGSNAFSACWDEVCSAFMKVAHIQE